MHFRSWRFFLSEMAQNIGRNAWMALASSSTVAVSLFVLGSFLLVAVNLQHVEATLVSEVQVAVYLQSGLSTQSEQAIGQQIKAMPAVASVRFVSKEQALEQLRSDFGSQAAILDWLDHDNPLPDSYFVQVRDPGQVAAVATAIGAITGVSRVSYEAQVVQRLFTVIRDLRWLGLVVGLVLLGATATVVANTVRLALYARRLEISIMQLVGATDWFVRWPYLLEGGVIGAGGGAAAVGLLWVAYAAVSRWLAADLPFLPTVSSSLVVPLAARDILAVGVILGVVGSWVSLRRFLRT